MRRPRLVMPREQLFLIMPVVAVVIFCIVSGTALLEVVRGDISDILIEAGVQRNVIDPFFSRVDSYFVVYGAASVILAAIAFLWAFWVSFRVFGPFKRLEKDLAAIEKGDLRPEALTVRQGDFLFPIIILVKRAMLKLAKR